MQASLILVRHAAPRIAPGHAAPRWTLSDEGRIGAQRLATQLAPLNASAIVSSPEPKAHETADIIARHLGLSVEIDDGFVEHKRPDLGFGTTEGFNAAIRRVFESRDERFFGGESANEALVRFEKALVGFAQRPLIVVTHGTVLSLFAGRGGADSVSLWSSLKLPEAIVLDEGGRVIARIG